MTSSNTHQTVSRRSALAGFGAAGAGLVLAAATQSASAQGDSLAGHPQIGVWMIDSPIGRAIAVYSAEGSVITALAASQAGPAGVAFSSTQIGTWEATSERGAHLTVVQLLSDGAGAYTGSVTVDAFQEVTADGQSWMSTAGSSITIRDAADNILDVVTDFPPATATRMGPGNAGFPDGTPDAATPTS